MRSRELLQESPEFRELLREWPFHSESFFPSKFEVAPRHQGHVHTIELNYDNTKRDQFNFAISHTHTHKMHREKQNPQKYLPSNFMILHTINYTALSVSERGKHKHMYVCVYICVYIYIYVCVFYVYFGHGEVRVYRGTGVSRGVRRTTWERSPKIWELQISCFVFGWRERFGTRPC